MKDYQIVVRVEGAESWKEAEMAVIRSFAGRPPDGMSFHIQPETPEEVDDATVEIVFRIVRELAEEIRNRDKFKPQPSDHDLAQSDAAPGPEEIDPEGRKP